MIMCLFIYRRFHYLLSGLRGLNRRGAHPCLGSGAAPAPSARGFFYDQSGVVVVLVALAMPVLLGMTAIILAMAVSIVSCASPGALYQNPANFSPPVPASYPDEPACKVKSIQRVPSAFEDPHVSPDGTIVEATKLDANGIYQLYLGNAVGSSGFTGNNAFKCVTCTQLPGYPRIDRNKTSAINWHPSGQWLAVGVEENTYDLMGLPLWLRRAWLNCGIWLNMWITTPTGDRWYQLTDFKNSGFTGPSFTPDGKKAVWAEIVGSPSGGDTFGIWKLYIADFVVNTSGVPALINKKEITPAGARWLEPGNFSPDGKHMLFSSSMGIPDAEGQDQWTLDIYTGALHNLTNTPTSWDEHGWYSPDGRKIVYMSSYPYRNDPNSYKTFSLHTEFMLMSADGSHLQQLTHFNVPGYPESQGTTVAAGAQFTQDGTQLLANTMAKSGSFGGDSWLITFEGPCGNHH